jgi:predicted Fe-Mo cluster-binding NifX family protein
VKLAITVWNERIAPVFDSAGRAVILEVCRRSVKERYEVDLVRQNTAAKIAELRKEGVGLIICGALSREAEAMILEQEMLVLPFVAGSLDAVIKAWIERQLNNDDFSMPGCLCRGRRERGTYCSGKTDNEI